jgi:copper(I)-binding protein
MTRRPTGRQASTSRRRTALLVATLLGAAALVLSGCSAGAVTQTDTTVSSVGGAEGQVGQILLRDITLDAGTAVVVPAGASITIAGTLVNQGLGDDQLISVTSPYFSQVRSEGDTTIPGNAATRMVGSRPGPVGPPSPTQPDGTMRITGSGVTQVLHAGPTYPVTFTFAKAGAVTLPVFVQTTTPVPAS